MYGGPALPDGYYEKVGARRMRSLELFSGAGGLALGLSKAGFTHKGFVEFNKHACATLRENFPEELVFEGDIRDVDFKTYGKVDVVAGGPPCQPFSMGGKHQAFSDTRDMFPYAIRAITALGPKAFIFENVKGLLRATFSDYFDYVKLRLAFPEIVSKPTECWQEHLNRLRKEPWDSYSGLKYRVSHKLLNAADFGVPQARERVFILGIREDLSQEWNFPQPTHSKWALQASQCASGDYWTRHDIPAVETVVNSSKAKKYQPSLFEPELLPWRTVRDALCEIPHPAKKHNLSGHNFRDGARTYPGHTGSFIDAPAKTLKAGVHGVPGGENMVRYRDGSVRYFTVFEGKILQTFPANYEITGAWGEGMRQIGNAVPVQLAHVLGVQIKDLIQKSAKSESKAA